MGSSGGFAMKCFKINESPIEGDSEQISAHRTDQPNSDVYLEVDPEENNLEEHSQVVHSEEKNLEVHLEAQLEQSLSLQDWSNRESQLHATEYQSHMTEY